MNYCPHCDRPLYRHCRKADCTWTRCRKCALVFAGDKEVPDVDQAIKNNEQEGSQ